MVICTALDCVGHYENDLAASVFFNVRIVSKSPAELSPPSALLSNCAASKYTGLRLHHLKIMVSAVAVIYVNLPTLPLLITRGKRTSLRNIV